MYVVNEAWQYKNFKQRRSKLRRTTFTKTIWCSKWVYKRKEDVQGDFTPVRHIPLCCSHQVTLECFIDDFTKVGGKDSNAADLYIWFKAIVWSEWWPCQPFPQGLLGIQNMVVQRKSYLCHHFECQKFPKDTVRAMEVNSSVIHKTR